MAGNAHPAVRHAVSFSRDPEMVAEELFAQLAAPRIVLVVIFISADQDVAGVVRALQDKFAPVIVIGCTTAGEITPSGYAHGSVVGASFCAPYFTAAPVLVRELRALSFHRGQEIVREARDRLEAARLNQHPGKMFAFTLIDGLSGCEENLVSVLHAATGEIPLFGGSAGDDLRFERTLIAYDGDVYDDAAVFVLMDTTLPFRVFKTEHFVAGTEKVVVTEADPQTRTVSELNAEPAAMEYFRIIGVDAGDFPPRVFANHPVVVRSGGENFVRSIQKMNADGSLTFFCAIDKGVVLTVARGTDLMENLASLFRSIRRELGPPALILGFDCILRGLEMDEKGIRDEVGRMMTENNVIGFSTFGEQYQSMHVNQILAGIAIGAPHDT